MTHRNRHARKYHLLAVSIAAALTACGGGGDSNGPQMMSVDANGVSTIQAASLASVLGTYPLQALSTAEMVSLLQMREEEQLAHATWLQRAASDRSLALGAQEPPTSPV